MNPAITEDMAAAVDETADFMHQTPPPFPTVARAVGIPACKPSKLYTTKGLVTPYSRGISIPSREQGIADADRNRAIRGR